MENISISAYYLQNCPIFPARCYVSINMVEKQLRKGESTMKKILVIILTAVLSFSFITPAYADRDDKGKNDKHHQEKQNIKKNSKQKKDKQKKAKKYKAKKVEFNIKKSPVIKNGRYKLPINPVTKGMGADVDYKDGILTVTKDDITIVINFKNETVAINGVIDTSSGLFKPKNNNGMTVLIKYIAQILDIRVDVDDDEIEVELPTLTAPKDITVTPVGSTIISNTLNTSTLFLTAKATIKAGQATGGRAELYIGSKLVATDSDIKATDTSVTFNTSDGTPTNEELQRLVPKGGEVQVRLYNSKNEYVVGKSGQKLLVDYEAPTISEYSSASFNPENRQLHLYVKEAREKGDIVDVTLITLYDSSLGKTYKLTNTANVGSSGIVKDANTLLINIGSADMTGLAGFGGDDVHLIILAGSLLRDSAGNVSPSLNHSITLPVTAVTKLDAPTNIALTPIGTVVVPNTINSSTIQLTATANIVAGQAEGGRAELYVGDKLIAIDTVIKATDTSVTFTTLDFAPTLAELMKLIPTGGDVSVKLYNANNDVVTSKSGPTLKVDYIAPTLTNVSSVIYSRFAHQLYFTVSGAGAVGDIVDVTMITLHDPILGKSYKLTASNNGSEGFVNSENSLVVNIGKNDRYALTGFESENMYITIAPGSLIKDQAGNASPIKTDAITIPIIVIK
ncbi:MAG: hypothetical protein EWM47_02550 [Anaerolineaceae bacterium]|nr:MAG: hypothetical protein EWM47_02550 [Anaerolineaceae bacterium]